MHDRSISRKRFLIGGGIRAAGLVLAPFATRAQPGITASSSSPAAISQSADNVPDFPEHDPPIDRILAKRFVIAGHFNLAAIEKMLAEDPTLINGCIDWGKGDFETA